MSCGGAGEEAGGYRGIDKRRGCNRGTQVPSHWDEQDASRLFALMREEVMRQDWARTRFGHALTF